MGDTGHRGILIEARKRIFAHVDEILNGDTGKIDIKPDTIPESQEEIEYLLSKLIQIRSDLSGIERFFDARFTGGILNENRLPQINLGEIINSLELSKKRSLWLQEELKKDIIIPPGADHHEYFLERVEKIRSDGKEVETLLIIAHNDIILKVSGPPILLDFIQKELSRVERWTEHEILHGIPLPASTAVLDNEIRSLKTTFIDLRDKSRDIIDQIEHLLVP
jgi:hypothetical protein